MTRLIRIKFRRLVVVLAIGVGALGLAVGTTAAASAATTAPAWGHPTPSPSESYTPPPRHHKPEPVCFYSAETESDTLGVQYDQTGNQGPSYSPEGAPTSSYGQPSDSYGQQSDYGQHNGDERETVKVEQIVLVCVTEVHNKWGGTDDTVTVKDVTGPFAWIAPAEGYAPTPSGISDALAPFVK